MEIPPALLAQRFTVVFKGESGQDRDGITREFLHLASRALCDPSLGLFRYSSESQERLEIDPARGFNIQRPGISVKLGLKMSTRRRNLLYFRFFGRIVGLTLLYHSTLNFDLVPAYFKHIRGDMIELNDLAGIEPQLLKNIRSLDEIEDVEDLLLSFSVDGVGKRNKPVVYDLVDDGQNIPVDHTNKDSYQNRFMDWRLRKSVLPQLDAILEGIAEVIPISTLKTYFHNATELRLVISGVSRIELEDWRANTVYMEYDAKDDVIVWFWEVLIYRLLTLSSLSRHSLRRSVHSSCYS
jgi:hypothetical protein